MCARFLTTAGLLILGLAGLAAAASIRGRVIEEPSGDALASAEMKVHRAGAAELVADLESDSNGVFEARSYRQAIIASRFRSQITSQPRCASASPEAFRIQVFWMRA